MIMDSGGVTVILHTFIMVMVMNSKGVVMGHCNRGGMCMGVQGIVMVMSVVVTLRVVMIIAHPFGVGMSNIHLIVVMAVTSN